MTLAIAFCLLNLGLFAISSAAFAAAVRGRPARMADCSRRASRWGAAYVRCALALLAMLSLYGVAQSYIELFSP